MRTVAVYATALGLGAVALQWLEYRYVTRAFSTEIYIGIVAAAFVALGVWVGQSLAPRARQPGFERNEAAIHSLGRFGRALALGTGIAAVAGIIYVIGWELNLAFARRNFMAEYSQGIFDTMRADGASASAIAEKQGEMRSFAEMYRNPGVRLPLTFIEIFPVGLLVALVSAGLLRDPARFPARA